jgi:hypothetical protein
MLVEKSYELLNDVLTASNLDDAMIRLEQALPCLLHLENRTSETLIEHLLRRGITLREGDKEQTKQLMMGVEQILNEEIFGSVGCKSNWKFPVNDDGSMGAIKFANWRARRVTDEIENIVNLCIPGDERLTERTKWKETIYAYQRTIKVRMFILM